MEAPVQEMTGHRRPYCSSEFGRLERAYFGGQQSGTLNSKLISRLAHSLKIKTHVKGEITFGY